MKINEQVEKIGNKHQFNGVIFVGNYHKKLSFEGFGYMNVSTKTPMNKKALFRIGSITKQFTAVAIMQLVEQKLLSLSDSLAMYIDEVDYEEDVTIHHLLSNSSGIPNFNPEDQFEDILTSHNVNERLVKEIILKKPLNFKPGTRFDYSSSGYIILAYLIEVISKKAYDVYLKENIFKPLKMKQSGFHYNDSDDKGFATMYDMDHEKVIPAEDIDMRVASGGGGLYSSALDLFKWYKGLLGYRILSRSLLDKMFMIQTPIQKTGGYGYGVIVDTIKKGEDEYPIVYHPGNGPGLYAQTMIYDNRVILIMLSNINDAKKFNETHEAIDALIIKELLK